MTTHAVFHQRVDDEVELRVLDEGDADELFALADRNRLHLRAWLPWVDGTRSVHDVRSWLRTAGQQDLDGDGFQAGIRYLGVLAGVAGYHRIDWRRRQVALGYWLGREFEGRGIMTRSCRALVEHAFRGYRLDRVEIRAAAENHRSRAVAERLGFRREGFVHRAEWLYDHFVDHVVYGMSAEEWAAREEA